MLSNNQSGAEQELAIEALYVNIPTNENNVLFKVTPKLIEKCLTVLSTSQVKTDHPTQKYKRYDRMEHSLELNRDLNS